jgi:hypothetical protein
MVDWFPSDTAGDPISTYHQELLEVVATAQAAAFAAPSAAIANQLQSAVANLERLISDRYENPDCSWIGNLPGQATECYSNSCLLWLRADAGLIDEQLALLACGDWQNEVVNWTQEIANLLETVSSSDAEFVQSVADSGANQVATGETINPELSELLDAPVAAVPTWLKVAAIGVGVLWIADRFK